MGQNVVAGGVKEWIHQWDEDGTQDDAQEERSPVDAQEECEDEEDYPEEIPLWNERKQHTQGKCVGQLARCPVCVQGFKHLLKIVYHLCLL